MAVASHYSAAELIISETAWTAKIVFVDSISTWACYRHGGSTKYAIDLPERCQR